MLNCCTLFTFLLRGEGRSKLLRCHTYMIHSDTSLPSSLNVHWLLHCRLSFLVQVQSDTQQFFICVLIYTVDLLLVNELFICIGNVVVFRSSRVKRQGKGAGLGGGWPLPSSTDIKMQLKKRPKNALPYKQQQIMLCIVLIIQCSHQMEILKVDCQLVLS